MNRQLAIFGEATNTLTRQAIELAKLLGYAEAIVTDQFPGDSEHVFLSLEDREQRRHYIERHGNDRFINLFHPSAYISSSATFGCNVFVGANAIVGMNATIGNGVVQNALSSIEHDNRIGAYSFLGTGAILCGRVETGDEVFIGGGATIKPGTRIGARTTIGTGAVLIKDADPDSVYVGNPARKLEK